MVLAFLAHYSFLQYTAMKLPFDNWLMLRSLEAKMLFLRRLMTLEDDWRYLKMLENTSRHLKNLNTLEDTWRHLKKLEDTWRCLKTLEEAWRHLKMLDDTWWCLITLDDAWWHLLTLDDASWRCSPPYQNMVKQILIQFWKDLLYCNLEGGYFNIWQSITAEIM